MALTLPHIELPWNRKRTTIAGIELPRVDTKAVEKTVERIKASLPKVDASKVESSVAGVTAAVDDARRALGSGAEQAAERASHIGQDAGASLRSLGSDIGDLTRDVRSLRITRQKQQRPDIMPGVALLAGIGGGLAAMFFFDPEQGRRRRALLRDQLVKWTRVARESVGGRAEDLRNRAKGLAHETGLAGAAGSEGASEATWGTAGTDNPGDELAVTDAAAARSPDADTSVYSTSPIETPYDGEGYPEATGSREVH